MSAIAGIYQFDDKPVELVELRRMADALAYRGPDGTMIWSDGSIGLVHSMLRTAPSSLYETMPFVGENGIVITADARLDNRDELIARLRVPDSPAQPAPDSLLLLTAYAAWGQSCVDYLLGDFAFAIWDAGNRMLFCARDHFGLKPFYYTVAGSFCAFATEVRALVALPSVPRRPNESKIAQFLINDYEDKTHTFFDRIQRLAPGHTLTITPSGEPRLRRYWVLDPDIEIRRDSDEAYVEEFRDLFIQAVRCRMRSAFPVGSMLSGGLDSSAVTCVARDVLRSTGAGPLDVFSAVTPSLPAIDETTYIQAVLDAGDLRSSMMLADEVGPLYDRERMLNQMVEPIYAANTFLEWGLRQQAQQRGVRVLLNGLDGDNIVSHGHYYWSELALAQKWKALADDLQLYVTKAEGGYSRNGLLRQWGLPILAHRARQRDLIGLARDIHQVHTHFNRPYRSMVSEFVFRPLAPSFLLRALGKRPGNPSSGKAFTLRSLVSTDLARRTRLDGHTSSDDYHFLRHKEAHYRVITWGIAPWFFELEDLTSAPFHMEASSPFFDKRLVEYSYGIPPQQKLAQGWPRLILRRAMEGILPPAVQWRFAKSNYGASFVSGLVSREGDLLNDVRQHMDVLKPYINPKVLRSLLERTQDPSQYEDSEALALWKIILLSCWIRQTVEQSVV